MTHLLKLGLKLITIFILAYCIFNPPPIFERLDPGHPDGYEDEIRTTIPPVDLSLYEGINTQRELWNGVFKTEVEDFLRESGIDIHDPKNISDNPIIKIELPDIWNYPSITNHIAWEGFLNNILDEIMDSHIQIVTTKQQHPLLAAKMFAMAAVIERFLEDNDELNLEINDEILDLIEDIFQQINAIYYHLSKTTPFGLN